MRKHHGQEHRDQEMPFNGGFHYYSLPLFALRLNSFSVADVNVMKKCSQEDLWIASLCTTLSNLSLDDPLLPYEDLKLHTSNIDVDYSMGLPASEDTEEASYIRDVMDEFGPGLDHVSETEDVIMDSACDLIDFNDEVFMPMEDIKVYPSCCGDYEDGLPPTTGAFKLTNDIDLGPMVVDTPPLHYSELLLSLRNLNLEVPAELDPLARPTRKVIRKATRARAGGRRDIKASGIDSRPSREYFISLLVFRS